jgi:hypothetical protein
MNKQLLIVPFLFNTKDYVRNFKKHLHCMYNKMLTFFISYCRSVSVKNIDNGKSTVIYNAKEVISGLNAPIVKDPGVIHL